MALDPVVVDLGALLGIVALIATVLAFRHRLAFRIAMRNVRRGRVRTVLLIAGLLVGTTIVSGSLVVGDTVQQLSVHYTYLALGYTDEAIFAPSPSGVNAFYAYSIYTRSASLVSGNSAIAGVTPELLATATAYDLATRIPETNLNLVGVNSNQSGALGPFVADNGTSLAGAAPGGVLLDDQTAQALNASVGDTVVVYATSSTPLRVQAIVHDDLRGAFLTGGLTPGDLFVNLATAQALENASGRINFIAVTNAGSQAAGADASSSVSAYLNSTLAGVLSGTGLTVHTLLANSLSSARASSMGTTTIFLVLGLFSIVAGALLIVGIFVMLAEERKGEMGMLRAIGLPRRELVYSFLFEGIVYAAGSALAGAFLGVGVGYLLVYLASNLLQGIGIPSSAFLQSFTVSPTSLAIAYVVGFLLTLVTVVFACRRASRLNIVRAIRDIPEPPPRLRTYTFLAYVGGALLLLGLLLFGTTYRGTGDISLPIIGGAVATLGAGLVGARFVKNRPIFSSVGIALVVWAGFEPLHTSLLGSGHSGGIFIVFVEGILMVGGVLLLFVFNATAYAHLAQRMFGKRSNSNPVVRIGLGYPTRQPTRTAVSLTIFALVVFTMVATASFGATIEAGVDTLVADQSGGYTFFGYSVAPIPNLWGQISANRSLAPLFTNAVTLATGTVGVNVSGFAGNPYSDQLYAPLGNATGPGSFLGTNQFRFSSTENGASAAQTMQQLATNASVAVVDQNYAPTTSSVSGGPSAPHPRLSVGDSIQVSSLDGTRSLRLTVIGILSEQLVTGVWVSPSTASRLGVVNGTAYFLTTAAGVSSTHAAQVAKSSFFRYGLVLLDLRGILATSISTTDGFVGLLEIFVGLGLGVGIAAMGILALRAVVERRREIGVLRAAGFTQRRILLAFILEYSFVTLTGVLIGVALGLLIVFNLTTSPGAMSQGVATFAAPWLTIAEIGAIAYGLVLVAIAGPSIRAARLPPVDAIRTSE